MSNVIPDKIDQNSFAISLVGVDEFDLHEQEGNVVSALEKIIGYISIFLIKDSQFNIEEYVDEKLINQYKNAKLFSIEHTYMSDGDEVVDQSLIGGTLIELRFKLKDNSDKVCEVVLGKSTLMLMNDTFQVITGNEMDGDKLSQVLITKAK